MAHKKTSPMHLANKKTGGKLAVHSARAANKPAEKRNYVSQADVPSLSLMHALRVPRAIAEHDSYKPTSPLKVAAALDIQPNSGTFRALAGASIAYGLTKGGPNAEEISIEPLGMKIVRPTSEGEDIRQSGRL
jgi:hypothetical protein